MTEIRFDSIFEMVKDFDFNFFRFQLSFQLCFRVCFAFTFIICFALFSFPFPQKKHRK